MDELARRARRLLTAAPGEGDSSRELVIRVERVCGQLTAHLSRIIGESGVTLLMRRSVALASDTFPFLLATPSVSQSACPDLRVALEPQPPAVATDAFIAVLTIFIGLLKRLIGDGLVERLLDEVWPTIFPLAVKETP